MHSAFPGTQNRAPSSIAPWARAEIVFATEIEEFNEMLTEQLTTTNKRLPQEVGTLAATVADAQTGTHSHGPPHSQNSWGPGLLCFCTSRPGTNTGLHLSAHIHMKSQGTRNLGQDRVSGRICPTLNATSDGWQQKKTEHRGIVDRASPLVSWYSKFC